jgi:hypothetical protein
VPFEPMEQHVTAPSGDSQTPLGQNDVRHVRVFPFGARLQTCRTDRGGPGPATSGPGPFRSYRHHPPPGLVHGATLSKRCDETERPALRQPQPVGA